MSTECRTGFSVRILVAQHVVIAVSGEKGLKSSDNRPLFVKFVRLRTAEDS